MTTQKKCSCGFTGAHISDKVIHCYDGTPCYLKLPAPKAPWGEWEERFKEVFYKEFDEFGFKAIDTTHDNVLDFIRSTLSLALKEERKRVVEMVRGMKFTNDELLRFDRGEIRNNTLEEFAARLEGEI